MSEQKTSFDEVYQKIQKLEADGKSEEAKALLKSFLSVAEEIKPKGAKVAATSRKIKMRAIRACLIGENIIEPGNEFMASEDEAKMLEEPKPGYFPFYGYMPEIGPLMDGNNPLDRKQLTRAERIR